jgi:hypothetical protein
MLEHDAILSLVANGSVGHEPKTLGILIRLLACEVLVLRARAQEQGSRILSQAPLIDTIDRCLNEFLEERKMERETLADMLSGVPGDDTHGEGEEG